MRSIRSLAYGADPDGGASSRTLSRGTLRRRGPRVLPLCRAMTEPQRILPIRRDYNRFVADETLEDYALRFTA